MLHSQKQMVKHGVKRGWKINLFILIVVVYFLLQLDFVHDFREKLPCGIAHHELRKLIEAHFVRLFIGNQQKDLFKSLFRNLKLVHVEHL